VGKTFTDGKLSIRVVSVGTDGAQIAVDVP
jgi:hypothetical protein